MKKGVFLRALGVVALVLAFLAVGAIRTLAFAADGEFAELLLPKDAYRDTYIAVEIVQPAPNASPKARASMWVLRSALQDHMRPQKGSEQVGRGKCTIEIQQLEDTDPTYWVVCESDLEEDKFMAVGHSDDSEAVLRVIREFSQLHFVRIKESILRKQSGKGALRT